MPKTNKSKKSKKVLCCPKCGGREFKADVGAYEVYKVIRGRMQYQSSVVSDETNDAYRCRECGAEAPEQLVAEREVDYTPNLVFG